MNKIGQFIIDNNLDITDLESGGSEGNSIACILSGYALYLDMSFYDLTDSLLEYNEDVDNYDLSELERVYEFAKMRNYGNWWNTPAAKSSYKF